MSPDGGHLQVTADLAVEVDGIPARVQGDGARIRVVADDVRGLVDSVRAAARATGSAGARADVARLAETLAGSGLTGVLEAPTGPVATVGADVDSAVGRLLWGSRRVHVDAVGLLRSSDAGRWALAAIGGLGVLAVLAVVRRRR
jgi:hypothetical protein